MRAQCESDLLVGMDFVKQQQGATLLALQDIPSEDTAALGDATVRIELCQRAISCVEQKSLKPHLLGLVGR